MPGVFDADTHIAESEAMWCFIDKEMFPRRPILARIPMIPGTTNETYSG